MEVAVGVEVDYYQFRGRPWRHASRHDARFEERWTAWRTHPCGPLMDRMLAERGLDEADVLMTRSGSCLAVQTPDTIRSLSAQADPNDQAAEIEDIGRDLDHVVAWLLRDRMIAATLADAHHHGPWILDPFERHGVRSVKVTAKPDIDRAAPLWAHTASSALLRYLAQARIAPAAAIRSAPTGAPGVWGTEPRRRIKDVRMGIGDGRLFCLSLARSARVDDCDGFDLLLPGCSLPETVAAGAVGHRLSQLVRLEDPPAVLRGLDPRILHVGEINPTWAGAEDGLRIRLDVGTETLSEIPSAALAALGIAAKVPRSVKPWLAPGLRADGSARR